MGGKISMPEAAKLIDETLTEEKKTDDTLSKLAVPAINVEAA
jgi:ferritin-like metal-binding protein YciE